MEHSPDPPPAHERAERGPPAEAAHNPILRAAWAYFIEDKSQAEVATLLNVSRSTVHNYLRQARDEGLVRISLDPDALTRSELANAICARFGLAEAYIVPLGAGTVMERVATAAGLWLEDLITPDGSVGVGWGETLYQIASHLPRRRYPQLTIVQLLGSLANPFGFSADRCSALLADRLGARCVTLHAPAVVSAPTLAAALKAEPVIASQLETLRRCDVALIGLGLAHRESHIRRSGILTAEESAHYEAAQAAAVVMGRFVAPCGTPIEGPLDQRMIGIPLNDLRAVPCRLLTSVGTERTEALRAALRGGFATHLVTDIESATALMALAP